MSTDNFAISYDIIDSYDYFPYSLSKSDVVKLSIAYVKYGGMLKLNCKTIEELIKELFIKANINRLGDNK